MPSILASITKWKWKTSPNDPPQLLFICTKLLNHSQFVPSREGRRSFSADGWVSQSAGANKAYRGLCRITTFYHACHHATHCLHRMSYCCCCWHNIFFLFSFPPHAFPAQWHLFLFKEAYAFPHLDAPLLSLSGKELKRFGRKVALNQSCL